MAEPLADALERVERAANEHWKDRARACLRWLCATRTEWTTDDFWSAMERWAPEAQTNEPRALGPLIRSVVAAGLCHKVPGIWVKGTRPQSHDRPIFIYRSTPSGSNARDTRSKT